MERDDWFRLLFALIALAGLLTSTFLLRAHYSPEGGLFCDISERINCDVVNKSPYATLFGIPVALLGALYYLGALAVALVPKLMAKLFTAGDEELLWVLFGGYATFGLAFSLYLTYVEAFILGVWCPFCVASALLVLIQFVAALVMAKAKY